MQKPKVPTLDNRISLQKLEILCLVVELGTVTRAAEHLFVAQPVVTVHLRSLEERLGVTLFVRSGRTLELTDAGQRVYEWASETLARGRALMRELQSITDGQSGAAVIGASMSVGSYLLPSVLTRFRRSRPQAELTLAIGDPESILRGVEQGDYDFSVVIRDTPPEGTVLEGELLSSDDIVLVTAPDGEPAEDEIDVRELTSIRLIGSPRGYVRRTLVDNALARHKMTAPEPVIELGHPEAMKRAVMEGMGATLLTRGSVEREIERGELREVRFTGVELTVPIYVVKRADKRLSELQRQLLQAIRHDLAVRAGAIEAHAGPFGATDGTPDPAAAPDEETT